MVNKANMRLVVAALRSGKYPQGMGRLKEITNDGTVLGYCCMGVMCEVAIAHGVSLETHSYPLSGITRAVGFDGSSAFLRANVLNWLGLEVSADGDGDPIVETDGNEEISASYANDSGGWDFNQIADSMEAYYQLLEDDDEPVAVD
jgi:hypothetical protein